MALQRNCFVAVKNCEKSLVPFSKNIGCFQEVFYKDSTFRNDVEKQTKNSETKKHSL